MVTLESQTKRIETNLLRPANHRSVSRKYYVSPALVISLTCRAREMTFRDNRLLKFQSRRRDQSKTFIQQLNLEAKT